MPSAPRTARATARAELTRAILDSAGAQLAEVGPAALSVRAVARDLGMASSAVYRYFPSRDALLTALLVEAYDDLGAAVEQADARVPETDLTGRWRAACGALHDWARAHPHRYALAYGSPVPGYAAPTDTVGPALRTPAVLLGVVGAAATAGRTPRGDLVALSDDEERAIEPVRDVTDPPLPPVHTARALGAWATLLGHVSLELFGHLHQGVLDYDVHFRHVVDQLAADLGLAEG